MSAPLDRYLKPETDGPEGRLSLDDWNGLVSETGSILAELLVKAAGQEAVAATVLEILLQRVNDVLGPAFVRVGTLGDQVEARIAELNGKGVSADAIIDGLVRVTVTRTQRGLIDTAAQAGDLAVVAGAAVQKADKSTGAEALAGTSDMKWITPFVLAAVIAQHPSFVAMRKDLLLTELLAAEAKGDRVNMSAGIVDPYNDTSDINLTDVFYDATAKILPFRVLPVFPDGTLSVAASSTNAYVFSPGAGGSNPSFAANVFRNADGSYISLQPGDWFRFSRSSVAFGIRSIELIYELAVGTTFTVGLRSADGTTTLVNRQLVGGGGLAIARIDLPAPLVASDFRLMGVSRDAGDQELRIRAGRFLCGKVSDQAPVATVKGYGGVATNWGSWPDGAVRSASQQSGSAPYVLSIDFGSAVKLRRIGFALLTPTTGNWEFKIEGVSGGIYTTIATNVPVRTAGSGSAPSLWDAVFGEGFPAFPQYILTQTTGPNTFGASAITMSTEPGLLPSVLSGQFLAAAAPAAVRLGVQIKRYGATALADLIAEASRDDGVTWSLAALAKVGDQADGFEYAEGIANVSAQPIGSSMRYRLRGPTNPRLDLGGALMQWS